MMHRPYHTVRRRGFVFLLVLIVLAIGLIMVLASTERAAFQSSIAQDRINDYQRHHEMLGVRDLVSEWAQRTGNRDRLAESVETNAPFYIADLPGGVTVTVRAEDAQGAVLLPQVGALDSQLTFALNDLISRLPPARPDLVRAAGPAQVSLPGAPLEVLRALANGDEELFNILRAMQAEPGMDAARFATSLSTAGFSDVSASISQVITFSPSLYRLKVRVDEPKQTRRYTMLADFTGNMMPVFRSLKFVPGNLPDDPPIREARSKQSRGDAKRAAAEKAPAGSTQATPGK
jgi:hypothetical protein